MAVMNMSHFMYENFPPILFQVFLTNHNILHPTERSYLMMVYHKRNPFLQLLLFTGMYQPEKTNQRINTPTGKK